MFRWPTAFATAWARTVYRTRSRKLLLQALLLDPCVGSIAAAERILDDLLDLQQEVLPRFE